VSYSETINLVVGDTLPALTLTIRDRNTAASGMTLKPSDPTTWAPVNVTGATVRLFIRKAGETGAPSATLTCTVTNGAGGIVVTDFPSGTLDEAGIFDAEVQITFSGGGIQTLVDLIKLKVRDQIG
jgi:hypothetical protein